MNSVSFKNFTFFSSIKELRLCFFLKYMIHIRLSTLVEMPIKCELVGTPTHTNTHV